MSEESVARHYLEDAISTFHGYKALSDKALAQLKDEELFIALDEEGNSIAVIMKHIAGNMLSRWTDFLTSDGEKPNRNRDMEFVIDPQTSRGEIFGYWEKGWQCMFKALEPLTPEDFARKVLIRGGEHSITQAINRQLTHYAYHIGQLVFLAKHFRATEWKSLSIPRNKSAAFNAIVSEAPGKVDARDRFEQVVEFGKERESTK